MDRDQYNRLKEISKLQTWNMQPKLLEFLKEVEPKSMRSGLQNNSLHKGFEMVSHEAQNMGITMNAILAKAKIDVDVTPQGLKYDVFHPIMRAMYHIDSTTKLEKNGQIDNVWDKMMKFFGEHWHMSYIPFPSLQEGEADSKGRIKINN